MSENVQIGNVKTFTTHRVVAEVSGAGPVQRGILGASFVPVSIDVEYVRPDGARWQIDRVFVAADRDGLDSEPHRYLGLAGAPEWVREFVEQHMPKAEVPTEQSTWDRAWEVIAEVRDRYPRESDDQPTDEIVDALADAGLLADHPPTPATVHTPERTDLPPAADERAALVAAGFDLDEEYPEYGQASVIKAFRAGFRAGGASR